MAEIIPLKQVQETLTALDANKLQQILLERDESIERLAVITAHEKTIVTLNSGAIDYEAKIKKHSDEIAQLKNEHQKKITEIQKTIADMDAHPNVIAAKASQKEQQRQMLQAELDKLK